MAVFGKIDSRPIPNAVTATNASTQVTGGPGFKLVGDPNYINAGDIIEFDDGTRTPYVVAEVVSDTELRLSKEFAEGTFTGPSFRRTPPKQVASYVLAPIDTVAREILLISTEEAQLAENKEKGLCSPGWWLWDTYTTARGDTKYKANHIASISAKGALNAEIEGDDDTDGGVAADVASIITITQEPLISGAATEGDGVDLTVTATATTDQGTLSFQWQRQKTSNGRWVNITASTDGGVYGTSGSGTGIVSGTPVVLDIGAALWADDLSDPGVPVEANGYEYRVKFNNSVGGEEVVSTVDATLSVTPL